MEKKYKNIMKERRQQIKSAINEIEERLFKDEVLIFDVPKRGIMRFSFGKNEKAGGFPYFVRIEKKNEDPAIAKEFIPFGGVDARSQKDVVDLLFRDFAYIDRNLFEQALAERPQNRL